jgi:phosphoribosylformylglycinamidine (FGAM) synthase-like enzyme
LKDVSEAVTMDLKEAGNDLYLVGKFAPTFGGSHFSMINSQFANESVPDVNEITPQVYRALHQAIKAKLIRSCHDLSEGGLAVAAAEMCIGGRLGLNLTLNLASHQTTRYLFGETTGCLLVEIKPEHTAAFEKLLEHLPSIRIATVLNEPSLLVNNVAKQVLNLSVDQLVSAWNTPLQ